MNEKKVIKLNIKSENESAKEQKSFDGAFHSNPILQKMIFVNDVIKRKKFTFKDLLK